MTDETKSEFDKALAARLLEDDIVSGDIWDAVNFCLGAEWANRWLLEQAEKIACPDDMYNIELVDIQKLRELCK